MDAFVETVQALPGRLEAFLQARRAPAANAKAARAPLLASKLRASAVEAIQVRAFSSAKQQRKVLLPLNGCLRNCACTCEPLLCAAFTTCGLLMTPTHIVTATLVKRWLTLWLRRLQAACSSVADPVLLLCLLRLAYSDPALRDADGAVALTEGLLSDLLGRDAAAPDQRTDTPSPDAAVLVEADRSPSYTELELTVPGLLPQVCWRP